MSSYKAWSSSLAGPSAWVVALVATAGLVGGMHQNDKSDFWNRVHGYGYAACAIVWLCIAGWNYLNSGYTSTNLWVGATFFLVSVVGWFHANSMHVQEALHEQVNLLEKVNITLDETHSDLNQDAEDLEQNMKELDDQIEKYRMENVKNETMTIMEVFRHLSGTPEHHGKIVVEHNKVKVGLAEDDLVDDPELHGKWWLEHKLWHDGSDGSEQDDAAKKVVNFIPHKDAPKREKPKRRGSVLESAAALVSPSNASDGINEPERNSSPASLLTTGTFLKYVNGKDSKCLHPKCWCAKAKDDALHVISVERYAKKQLLGFEGEDISKKPIPEGTVVETKIETDEDGSWKYTMMTKRGDEEVKSDSVILQFERAETSDDASPEDGHVTKVIPMVKNKNTGRLEKVTGKIPPGYVKMSEIEKLFETKQAEDGSLSNYAKEAKKVSNNYDYTSVRYAKDCFAAPEDRMAFWKELKEEVDIDLNEYVSQMQKMSGSV